MYPPCLDDATVTVTLSGATGTPITVTSAYAGWVANLVGGLYQVNAKFTALTGLTPLTVAANNYNITVTVTPADGSGAVTSQAGVVAYLK
jgi:hypothetical protein